MKRKKEIDTDGLNEVIHLSRNVLRVIYIITIISIVLGAIAAIHFLGLFKLLIGVLNVISPVFIGFVIAWLFYPLHKKMLDKGFNKVLSSIIILLVLIGIIGIFIYVFIPVISEQVNELVSYIPSVIDSVSNFLTKTMASISIKNIDISNIQNGLLTSFETFVLEFTSSLPNNIIEIIKGLFSTLGTIVISLIIAIYMLIDYDNIILSIHNLLPKKNHSEYLKLLDDISKNTRKVVNSTLFVAFLVFVFDTIGFAAIGLKSAMLFGLFCGLTDLIPYIGPYIGGGVAVIVGFTQGPIIGIGVLIIAIIVQVLESYILQPVVMSQATELSPIIIIVGLLVFGYFFGVPGMVIATPCMAIIKEIIKFIKLRFTKRKEELA